MGRVDLLPETRAFLRDWLDWVERGAPECEPYSREDGLCDSAWFRWVMGHEAHDDLVIAFGGDAFPFGHNSFSVRAHAFTQHECPKRLAFVRANV